MRIVDNMGGGSGLGIGLLVRGRLSVGRLISQRDLLELRKCGPSRSGLLISAIFVTELLIFTCETIILDIESCLHFLRLSN